MDQDSEELFILDWGLDIQDEVHLSRFSEVDDYSFAKPEVLAADLDPTAIAISMKPETSDLFHMLSDTSDTTSTSNGEDQLLTFDSDDEDMLQQQGNTSGYFATNPRGSLLAGLEKFVLCFLEQLGTNTLELDLVNRMKTKEDGSPTSRVLHWPKRTTNGSFKSFGPCSRHYLTVLHDTHVTSSKARLFRVVDLVHEALITNVPTTKRDIFYKDVPLFKTQSIVDDLVDDLAATLNVSRGDLNVRASPKGLFCGSGLSIHLKRGGIIHGTDSEGALIPAGVDISHLQISERLSWVLIVEKEAVFQTLCRANLASHSSCPGPGLVVTGKGYPDLATRELVSRLSSILPSSIPLFALVDADPYGLDILSVYKFGSQSLGHEGSKATASRIVWLGICASELASLCIDRDHLIPLTGPDHKKALQMLRRDDTMMPTQWRKELSYMLHSRRKAEIEILSSISKAASQINGPQHSALQAYIDDGDPITNYPLVRYIIPKLNLWVKTL